MSVLTMPRREKNGDNDEESLTQLILSGGKIPKDLSGEDMIRPGEEAIDYENEDELADEEEEDEEEHELAEDEIEHDHGMRYGESVAAVASAHKSVVDDGHHATNYDFDIHGGPYDRDDLVASNNLGPNEEDWRLAFADEGDNVDHNNIDEEPYNEGPMSPGTLADNFGPGVFGINDMELDEAMMKDATIAADGTIDESSLLRMYYPEFQKGRVLSMNKLFGAKPSRLVLPKSNFRGLCAPSKINLEIEPDQRVIFKHADTLIDSATGLPTPPNVVTVATNTASEAQELASQETEVQNVFDNPTVFEWNIEDGYELESDTETKSAVYKLSWSAQAKVGDGEITLLGEKRGFSLDLNDDKLLFLQRSQTKKRKLTARKSVPSGGLLRRYNISNDRAYDMLKENYQSKIRSTIGNLNIDHSLVALRLQSPHYKVRLSKAQKRSFHRPSFIVKPDVTIQFSKVKQRKRKELKGKPISQLLRKTGDLTLGDNIHTFLLEYCEEFPPVLNNLGMGSKLVNYYRKKSQDDNSRPKLDVGETHILGVQDRSAFWNFGFVEPGNIVPTLYNNMTRAPVFRHEATNTDFLMVRRSGGKKAYQQYFLRPLDHLLVVGQTFPVETVPGPHSRKVTTASKNRLKMIVYRVLNKSPHHRLQVKDISLHFPDQNDMQNRQRLKEFMEYQRSGPDQSFWKIKSSEILPNQEAIRAMITPEQVALLDSMQVGQQHLEDAGYGKNVDDVDEEAEEGTLEEQLAPWQITRNFVYATQGKAMLQLHGPGDPSGRGEGFSFLRTSMKGGFKAMGESVNDKLNNSKLLNGHSYNVAQQQKAYDAEIKRIWYTQAKSLSVKQVNNDWDDAEARRDSGVASASHDYGQSASGSVYDEDEMSLFSHTSTSTSKQQKILRITRKVKDANGILQRKVEIIRDPTVIRAYVKRRQLYEESKLGLDEMQVTNDENQNKRFLRTLELNLARLQRNQERRQARQQQKKASTSNEDGSTPLPKDKKTSRKCATCGAVGHIRTNKSCPMYKETIADKS